jgi:hypothetical protein
VGALFPTRRVSARVRGPRLWLDPRGGFFRQGLTPLDHGDVLRLPRPSTAGLAFVAVSHGVPAHRDWQCLRFRRGGGPFPPRHFGARQCGNPRREAVASRGGRPCAARSVTPPLCAARFTAARRGAPPTASCGRRGERRTLRRQRHWEGTTRERPFFGPRAATGSAIRCGLLHRGHSTPHRSRRSGPRGPLHTTLGTGVAATSPRDAMARPRRPLRCRTAVP